MYMILKTWVIVLCLAGVASAQIGFKAHVDKVQAAFEDEFVLTLEVSVGDPSVTTTPVPPPEMIGFRVGGSGSSVEKVGELTLRRYTYNLKPARSGEVTIPSYKVEFKSAVGVDTLTSDPIVVNVAQPRPSKDSRVSLAPIFITAAIGTAIIAGLLFRRRRTKAPVIVEADWKAEAQAKFAEIKRLAEREDYREFSSQASKFVVGLLEKANEARLTGYTTTDILRWMEERGIEKEIRSHCKELFAFCEEVKFSSGKVDVQSGRAAVSNATKLLELILK